MAKVVLLATDLENEVTIVLAFFPEAVAIESGESVGAIDFFGWVTEANADIKSLIEHCLARCQFLL